MIINNNPIELIIYTYIIVFMLSKSRNRKVKSGNTRFFRKTALLLFSLIIFTSILPTVYADEDTYKSAVGPHYPPFVVKTGDKIDGFSVELLKAVAEEIGIEVSFYETDWTTIKDELTKGNLDVVPIVAYTQERDEIFDFSVPYIIMHGNIFVRRDSDIETEEDLIGKEIIVMRNEHMHEFAISKNYTQNLILVETYEEAFRLLSRGEYDAVLAQNLVGQMIIDEMGLSNIKPASTSDETAQTVIKTNLEGFEQKFCFAVTEGDSELLSKLNEGLSIVTANGTFNRLYLKWFPFISGNQITLWDKIKSSMIITVPLIIVLLIGAVIITMRQIRKKKAELEKSNNTLLMLEAHLIQKQKLESIGTLASGVAHEINNPINGILNYSQLINDITCTNEQEYVTSCDSIKNYSNEIIRETKRISTIVSNLLQFSRTEKKSFSKADVPSLIEGVLSLVNISINRSEIELTIDIDENIYDINCRTQQIQQILVNLITNGKDALNERYPSYNENKKMIITAKNMKIKGDCWVRITIEDHGSGIPESVAESIFDPFFTTKDRTEGTGLGLSISYNIAQEHNGNLSFETQHGHYTRFHLDLPAIDRNS